MLRLLLVRYGHAVSRERTAKFIGAPIAARGGAALMPSYPASGSGSDRRVSTPSGSKVMRGTGYCLVIDDVPQNAANEPSALAA